MSEKTSGDMSYHQDFRFRPFIALLSKEIARFMKVFIQTVVTPLMNSTLYLLIFGVSLGANIDMGGDISYLGFLIPGLVMMGALNNSFQNSSSSIISAKFTGDIEDLKTTPLNLHQIIWAYGLGGVTRGFMVGSVTWLVGQVFYYSYHNQLLPVAHPVWLFFFLIIGALSFAFLGLTAAFWCKSFDQIAAISGFILLPLIYLGGVFFSLENLHPFWQKITIFNPLLYFINGVRYGMLGISDVSLTVAVSISIVSLFAFYSFAWSSLRYGRYTRW